MSEAAAFNYTCTALEEATALDRLEARGTVRLALRAAGLEASSVTSAQMAVVVEKVFPAELESRGIADAQTVCDRMTVGVRAIQDVAAGDTPDAVFARLGGGARA